LKTVFLFLHKIFLMRKFNQTVLFLFFFSLLSLFLSSCGNQFDVDISSMEPAKVKITQYEKALFDQQLNEKRINELQKEFPLFLGDLPLDSIQFLQLQAFVSDSLLRALYKKSKEVFPHLDKEEKQLTEAFTHIKYYYPSFQCPKVYTYLSGVQDIVFYQDPIIMLSIDHYLGQGYKIYQMLGTPKYKQFAMQKKFLVKDILLSIAKAYTPPIAGDAKMIEQMIYEGKLLYFIKSMYPKITDEILFIQTQNHLNWFQEKESELWRYYIENELLYKADYLAYNKFINDAPFTAVLGDDSAPRTGIWLGYQIIYSYMKNSDKTLQEMLQNQNAQLILQQSKYRPSKY